MSKSLKMPTTSSASILPRNATSSNCSSPCRAWAAVKGIGAKTAQRIVIDLKDKLKKNDFPTEIFAVQNNTIKAEALSALTILGFSKGAVDKALDKLLKQMPEANVETLIKEALKIL